MSCNDNFAVIDALHRFAAGQDLRDPALLSGDEASLFALVEAQHLPRADHSRNLLLKNFYYVKLRRAGERWAIEHMRIENAWHRGDPKVLFP